MSISGSLRSPRGAERICCFEGLLTRLLSRHVLQQIG
jgi:hypothetical protein